MKTKLLLFLGLTIASVSFAIAFNTSPAHAAQEKYVWTSATTIQASGGKYRGTTTFTVTTQKQISGSTTELVANDVNIDATYGDCDHTLGRLSFHNGSKDQASLWMGDLATGTLTSCGTYPAGEQGMDGTVNVVAQAAPAVNYNTVNCDQTARTADGLARCKAIQACVVDANKPQDQCVTAMDTCITNHTANGAITEAAKTDCLKKVTAGDTGGASAAVKADDEKTSCAIVGIGWIICPITTFMALIVDAAYSFVASLLVVQPLVVTGGTGGAQGSQGIYNAWTVMRNFANISFVLAFLLIIFSQLSSIGITNYGIKKMLPKLIVSAILVNISFWVCAAAVDLSNIAGSSVNNILQGVKDNVVAIPTVDLGPDSKGTGLAGLAGYVLAGGAAVGVALYVGLSALLPVLISAILIIVVVFLVLTLRQALIILLVVVAPLAFVAYLLPNTQSLFKKWKDLFQVLLIMYPLISLVFGASALASTVVMGSAAGPYKMAIQIMGAAISILPLIVVPTLIKTTTGVLGKFGAFVDNPNKGPISAMKKGADGFRNGRQQLRDARALNGERRFGGSFVRRGARRQAVLGQRERNYNNAKSGYIADQSLSTDVNLAQRTLAAATGGKLGGKSQGDQLLDKMGEGGGEGGRSAALAQAVSVQAKIEAEEVTAAAAVIKNLNLDRNQDAMRKLSMGMAAGGLDGSSSAVRAAAMKNVVDSHDVKGVNDLLDNVGTMDTKTREAFADSLASSSQKPEYVGQSAISNIRQHGELDASGTPITAMNSTQLTVEAIKNNTYSVDKLATGDKDELIHVAKIAADPANGTNNAQLKANATIATTDPRYSGRIAKNKTVVEDITKLP